MKYTNVTSAIQINKSVKVILKQNPLLCDCNAYHLVKYFKGMLEPEVNLIVSFDGTDLICAGPQELKDTRVVDLDPRVLTCPMEKIYDKEKCPENCECYYRPSDTALIIDCSYKGLKTIPPSLLNCEDSVVSMLINHTEVDLSGNRLTSLPNELGYGYSNATKIYLSHNNLTKINLTIFSHELQVDSLYLFYKMHTE